MRKIHTLMIGLLMLALAGAASLTSSAVEATHASAVSYKHDLNAKKMARRQANLAGTASSLLAPAALPCSSLSFAPRSDYLAGTTPTSVAIGDFNGDGKQDLVTTNQNSNDMSVLLGDGAGGFGAATNFGAGNQPFSMVVGDFNGDGKQDLAAANISGNVSVLLGDGSGSFGAASNFGVGILPYSIALGDFDGDGKQDLVTSNLNSHDVSILLGDGSGSFGVETRFPVSGAPSTVVVGDFNGDGKQDLATANVATNVVSILLGDGTGSFTSSANFGVGSIPRGLALADFNNDGKQDLVTANQGPDNVSILLGDGLGSFTVVTGFSVGLNPFGVAVGDFNGDGKQDVVVANTGASHLSVLIGDGAGSFSPAITVGVGDSPVRVAVGDFNGDGQPDLASADSSANVSVLLGQCSQTNQPPIANASSISVPANSSCQASITAAQVDNGSFDPDSGDTITLSLDNAGPFSLGPHHVTLTATDNHGATGSAQATVTVVDTTPPAIALNGASMMTIERGSIFTDPGATANDGCAGNLSSQIVRTGSVNTGAVGTYTLIYLVSDGPNSAQVSRTVKVVDTTPPSISCPASLTVDATSPAGAGVSLPTPVVSDLSHFTVGFFRNNGQEVCAPCTFAMGTNGVTVTATDEYHNSRSCSFSVIVRAPRKVMQDVLAQLIALRSSTSNRHEREQLADAIRELTESLDPRFWLDDSHLRTNKGDRVFHEERDGIHELLELIRCRQSTIPDAVLQALITRLVQADRVLALIAIKEAVARHGDPRDIAKANAAIADGDRDAAAGRPNAAVADYREAWDRALRA